MADGYTPRFRSTNKGGPLKNGGNDKHLSLFSEGRKAYLFSVAMLVSGKINPFLLVLNPNHEMKHTKPCH